MDVNKWDVDLMDLVKDSVKDLVKAEVKDLANVLVDQWDEAL